MNRGTKSPGFTLLELLVAASITVGIAAVMLSVTTGMLTLWRKTQAEQVQAVAARQVFDLVEQDIQAAFHRRDDNRWLALDIIDSTAGLANHGWLTTSARMKPADGGSLRPWPSVNATGIRRMADARFGLSGCWLRFVTTNIEAGGTLPVVVAYQIARRPVTGDPLATNRAPVRYLLYRSTISNSDTLANGYDVNAAGYASNDNSPFSALSSAYRNARNVMNPSHANLLASNVVDFGVWLYARNADGTLNLVYPSASNDLSHHARGGSLDPVARFPEVIDVMVRILSDEGATLLETIETKRVSMRPPIYATDADWWWGVVEANSRVFIRRIELKARAP